MHYNIVENAMSNNCLGPISYADVAAVTDSATDVYQWDSVTGLSDYISGGYVGCWEPASLKIETISPSREEFDALAAKVKELEDTLNRLWQAKAVGDLL